MIDQIGFHIAQYRKRLGMTQEELANKLGVSFQAVSKWENGQTKPDIALLGELAFALESDINNLLGYSYSIKPTSYYEDKYGDDDFYWGIVPSDLCFEALKLCPLHTKKRVLDVGCGEGKDAVFFARNGYTVDAFDIAETGVSKTIQLAASCNIALNAYRANLLDHRPEKTYDIIYASGFLNYLSLDVRSEVITHYQKHTNNQGIHVFNVFVKKPFVKDPPEDEPNSTSWASGELAGHYEDWYIHDMSETIIDCDSSGVAHKHCVNTLIAQKV